MLVAVVALIGLSTAAVAQDEAPANWQLDALDAEQAWTISRGEGVVVGVIDDIANTNHPDLQGRVVEGRNFIGQPEGENSHGTAMASLIVGTGQHVVRGLAPDARVLSAGVGSDVAAAGTHGDIAEGVRWAVANGATVLSISMNLDEAPVIADALDEALTNDVVVVAAAGNVSGTLEDAGSVQFPARHPGVIAVGATGRDGEVCSCSQQGTQVALTAPGEQITAANSTFEGGVGIGSGTSSSTAFVAATAALVRAEFPDLDAANVVNRLLVTARDLGPSGRDAGFGFGVVDPVAALTADVPLVEANPLGGPTQEPTPDVTDSAATSTPADMPASDQPTSPVLASPVPVEAGGDQSALGAAFLGGILLLLVVGIAGVVRTRSRRRLSD